MSSSAVFTRALKQRARMSASIVTPTPMTMKCTNTHPVDGEARKEFREGFREGYSRAMNHMMHEGGEHNR